MVPVEGTDVLGLDDKLRVGDPELWQKYVRCCDNLHGIEIKLRNGVPEGKRGALIYQRNLLAKCVIPQIVADLQNVFR